MQPYFLIKCALSSINFFRYLFDMGAFDIKITGAEIRIGQPNSNFSRMFISH